MLKVRYSQPETAIVRDTLVKRALFRQALLGLVALVALALVCFSTWRTWFQYASEPVFAMPASKPPMKLTKAEIDLLRQIAANATNIKESQLPPMVKGMFKTHLPMYYVADAALYPVKRQLMEIGFAPCGKLHFIPSIPSDNLTSYFDGMDVQQELSALKSTPQEFAEFFSYARMAGVAWESGEPLVILMQDNVSPAVSIFWDADLDEYVKVVDEHMGGRDKWDVVNIAYHYPERDDWRDAYFNWKKHMPFSRVLPMNEKFRSVQAAFWTREGLRKLVTKYSVPGTSGAARRFDCRQRPEGMTGCSIDKILFHEFGKSGLLMQPPLFAYRPIPEDTFKTGWKKLSDPGMQELQQAIADTFHWQAENSEVYEGLHGFLRLTESEQATIFEDAKRRGIERVKKESKDHMDDAQAQEIVQNLDPAFLLTQRLLEFLPDTEWQAVEF